MHGTTADLWRAAANPEDRHDGEEEATEPDDMTDWDACVDAAGPIYCPTCRRVAHECHCYDADDFEDVAF